MSLVTLRRALAVTCACSATAGGGYLLAAQTPAGAQAPSQSGQTRSGSDGGTPPSCPSQQKRDVGGDPAAGNAKRAAVEQFAAELGVSVDRLAQASDALKQQSVAPTDPRAASILAQQLGLDPSVVQAALTHMLAKFPFNQAATASSVGVHKSQTAIRPANSARTHKVQGQARKAQDGSCRDQVPPSDPNNPKAVALRNLAHGLGVTDQQLMDAFATAESHGVRDLDDPQMAAQLASALGKDPAHVQQLIDQTTAALRSAQSQAAGARK